MLQLVAFYSVIQWMRTLIEEYGKRKEIREQRKQEELQKESFQNEIKQYHARIAIENEQKEDK